MVDSDYSDEHSTLFLVHANMRVSVVRLAKLEQKQNELLLQLDKRIYVTKGPQMT